MADDDSSRNADFVARVVKDAKDPPQTRMLTGWLGDAAEEGERRLYTNPELSCYIDIPTDAILHTEPIRDSQPPGGVFVWVQRDAALKQGGSAASRAARFLQGQVQEDFASGVSPEAAGLRCITKVPCGEPTGFTGQCTKQPEVGGAWPCVTAVPHCFEPTGFTGKCTQHPWPNPTHYFGCTFLHCPTQDLTHIPHICNLVATGMPGCPVVNPPQGGDPARETVEGEKEGGGIEAERAGTTLIPGCGYTRIWGLCQTLPPKCNVSVDIPCITHDNACGITRNPACTVNFAAPGFGGFRAAGPGPVIPDTQAPCSAVDTCPTRIGCETKAPTVYCTQFPEACPTDPHFCHKTAIPESCPTCCGPRCQTQQQACTQCQCTQVGPQCPTGDICQTLPPACPVGTNVKLDCTLGCISHPVCPVDTLQPGCVNTNNLAAFRAAGPVGPSAFVGCTQGGPQCRTYPKGDCTFFGCTHTPATVCTQTFQCGASAVDACPTRLCGGGEEYLRAAAQIPSRLCQVQFWFTTVERICL